MKFRVQYLQTVPAPCVMARQLDEGEFSVSAGSTLGGAGVRPAVSHMPSMKGEGGSGARVYAFWLRSAADLERFKVGDEVEFAE